MKRASLRGQDQLGIRGIVFLILILSIIMFYLWLMWLDNVWPTGEIFLIKFAHKNFQWHLVLISNTCFSNLKKKFLVLTVFYQYKYCVWLCWLRRLCWLTSNKVGWVLVSNHPRSLFWRTSVSAVSVVVGWNPHKIHRTVS